MLTAQTSANSCAEVFNPETSIAPGEGTKPIGVDTEVFAPSICSMAHLITREFSPNPGHKNFPKLLRRNQLT